VRCANDGVLTKIFTGEIIMSHQIHSYTELQQQIHDDLRIQHPEWIEPNGDCPTCESYEVRLAQLLGLDLQSAAIRLRKSSRMGYAGDY
jgi:hypothetical protein